MTKCLKIARFKSINTLWRYSLSTQLHLYRLFYKSLIFFQNKATLAYHWSHNVWLLLATAYTHATLVFIIALLIFPTAGWICQQYSSGSSPGQGDALQELQKDEWCSFVKILVTASYKTAVLCSFFSHHAKHRNKVNKICRTLLENYGRS